MSEEVPASEIDAALSKILLGQCISNSKITPIHEDICSEVLEESEGNIYWAWDDFVGCS